MAIVKGPYVVWGNPLIATGAAVGAITGYQRSSTLTKDATIKEIMDGNSEPATVIAHNQTIPLTFDMVPNSITSQAIADGMMKLPEHLEVVTISGMSANEGTPLTNGKYLFLTGLKKFGGEEGEMTWNVKRYITNAANLQGT